MSPFTTATTALLVIFSLLFTTIHTININGECDHATHDHNDTGSLAILPHIKEAELFFSPDLTFSDYPHLRIHADYSLLEPTSKKDYLIHELIPSIIDYFQGALRIKRPLTGIIQAPSVIKFDPCFVSTAEAFTQGINNTDHLLIITTTTEYNTNFAARSTICYRSPSGRPIVSKLKFNTENLPLPYGDPLIHEYNVYLAMHEMIHSLGFIKSSYNYYVDKFGNKLRNHFRPIMLAGKQRHVLDLEPLTSRMRKHFGCPSIPGALLEDNGDKNTMNCHFERRLFLHEVMTSGMLGGHRVSEFSLAVLEGSGWYLPDYSYAEPFSVGEGQGCEFWEGLKVENNTQSIVEYCTEQEARGCTAAGRGGGLCRNDSMSDGYSFYFPRRIYDCDNPGAVVNARLKDEEVFGRGVGSKCFSGTLSRKIEKNGKSTSFCFKYNCKGEGLDVMLEVMIGNNTVICRDEGYVKVKGYSGKLMCPDPISYCNSVGKEYCPRGCMGRGECVGNQCRCRSGYTGIDCSIGLDVNNKVIGGINTMPSMF